MFTELNVLELFFESPSKEFNVREVARLRDINPATASKRLKALRERHLLTYRKERMLDLYRADSDSDAYRDIKVYYNIRKLKDSGLIEALNKFYIKPTIILFGSASTGLDTESSDIDIAIVCEKITEFPEIKKFEKRVKRSLQLFVVKGLNELRNKHLVNNVLNGIVLQGELKWI